MELYHQRIEGTTKAIAQFKAEQEKNILGSARAKTSTQATAGRTNQNISAIATESSGDVVQNNRTINADVIIMPYCRATKSHQKLWPQALIANRSTSCAEVGLIESHGSLWKIIPCSESAIGSRVILQCSEKGETPRYLNANMELVDMKVDAAVWQMRPTTSNCTAPASEEEGVGVVVVFEMVDSAGSVPMSGSARQLLVCETSRELRSYSELFVEPVALTHKSGTFSNAYASAAVASALLVDLAQSETQPQQEAEGDVEGAHPTFRSCEWEVLPEAWLGGTGGDLDFLEGHIN